MRSPTTVGLRCPARARDQSIGLVNPILPAISADLGATPAQTMLLFTRYLMIAAGVLCVGRAHLARIDSHLEKDSLEEAVALTAADA